MTWLRSRRLRRILSSVLMLGGGLAAAVSAIGWLAGWRTHTMTTPSMGRFGPVGSVIISRPVSATDIRLGDVLVFHPPGRPGVTFVHRVISVMQTVSGPQFHTRGDINGAADSWTLTANNLVGRAVVDVPDAGFFLQMLPLILLGGFVLLMLTHTRRTKIKTPARILGGSILVAALLVIYRPLDRIDLIDQVRSGSQGHAAIVPTGILPVRVTAVHGSHADLTPGQVGSVVSHLTGAGAFRVNAFVHLQGWWWLLIVSWAVPLLIALCCRRQRVAKTLIAATRSLARRRRRQQPLENPSRVRAARPTPWRVGDGDFLTARLLGDGCQRRAGHHQVRLESRPLSWAE